MYIDLPCFGKEESGLYRNFRLPASKVPKSLSLENRGKSVPRKRGSGSGVLLGPTVE